MPPRKGKSAFAAVVAAGDAHGERVNRRLERKANPMVLKLEAPYIYVGAKDNALTEIRRAALTASGSLGASREAIARNLIPYAAEAVQQMMRIATAKDAFAQLTQAVELYQATEGPRPDDEQGEAWDTGLDEVVEALFSDQKVQSLLGAGWLGVNTIDTKAERPERRQEIATSYGATLINGAVAEMTDPTPAKILSAAGIVAADLSSIVDELAKAKTEGTRVMPTSAETAQAFQYCLAIAQHAINVLKLDLVEAMQDLEQAADSDETLASSSIQRLGYTPSGEIRQQFRLLSKTPGWVSSLVDNKPVTPAEPAADSDKPAAGGDGPRTFFDPPGGYPWQKLRQFESYKGLSASRRHTAKKMNLDVDAFVSVKLPNGKLAIMGFHHFAVSGGAKPKYERYTQEQIDAATFAEKTSGSSEGSTAAGEGAAPVSSLSTGDTGAAADAIEAVGLLKKIGYSERELSENLGVSRATLNNYIAGKSAWKVSPNQVDALMVMAKEARTNAELVIGKLL